MKASKSRERYSTEFGFKGNTAMVSYVSKKGKAVIMLTSEFEWLKRRAHDQHGLGSKSTRAILLCPWERHFMHFPCLVVLANSSK